MLDEAQEGRPARRAPRRRRGDQRLGRHQVRHDQHRALVRHPRRRDPDLRQNFPSDYNYTDETDRFRWAGRLWREADPAILDSVLDGDGQGERRVGADAWTSTRPAATCSARRRSPGSRTTCTRRWRTTSSPTRQPWLVLHRLELAPTRCTGRRTTASGWMRCATSSGRAAPSAAVTTPASSTRCTATA